jgi:hypothetical protein
MRHGTKYSKELLEDIVKRNVSIYGVLKELNLKLSGGNHSHIKRRIKQHGLDTTHFLGRAANYGASHKGGPEKLNPEDVLVYNRGSKGRREGLGKLRRALFSTGMECKCFDCGINSTYNNKPITLEIHHIDEDFLNNRIENLKFLCPNCHSQQRLNKNELKVDTGDN